MSRFQAYLPRLLDLCCLLAGAALPLAFAPFAWYPLALLAPAVLFYVGIGSTPARFAWRTWLFSFGLLGVGAFWLHISINQFGGVSWPLAVMITVLFLALMGLYAALFSYVIQRFFRVSTHWRLLLFYPAAWVMAEGLRGWLFGGFPWLLLGYSQIDHTLSNLAPYLGVYGVSWATATTAGILALLCWQWRRGAIAGGLLATLWLSALLLGQISWTKPDGQLLRIALIQGNIPQEQKWLPAQLQPSLVRYVTMSQSLWDEVDLVVWPETAVSAYYDQVQESFLDWLAEEAAAHNTALLIGIPVRNLSTGRHYNSLMQLGAAPTAFYHKRHLVPFGEYLPLRQWLSGILDFLQIPMSDFAAGSGPNQLLMDGYVVGASICYEDAFGEEVLQAFPEAHLLVNVSNDAWFGDSLAPHQHLQMAQMRAKETERSLLRATNTGISALISPEGALLAYAPQFSEYALRGVVQPLQGDTPYVRYGNLPVFLSLALVFLGGLWLSWNRTQ